MSVSKYTKTSNIEEESKYESKNYSKQSKSHATVITCPTCGNALDVDEQFCGNCGNQVEINAVCPSCKATRVDGAIFCPECGCSYISIKENKDSSSKVNNEPKKDTNDSMQQKNENILSSTKSFDEQKYTKDRKEQPIGDFNKNKQDNNLKADMAKIANDMAKGLARIVAIEQHKKQREDEEKRKSEEAEYQRQAEEKKRLEIIAKLESEKYSHIKEIQKKEGILKQKEAVIRDQTDVIKEQKGTLQKKDIEIANLKRKNLSIINENTSLKSKYAQIMADKKRLEQQGRHPKWKCNFCGALHNDPSECVEPGLGGTWV